MYVAKETRQFKSIGIVTFITWRLTTCPKGFAYSLVPNISMALMSLAATLKDPNVCQMLQLGSMEKQQISSKTMAITL
jgi:hypothetical protein